MTGSDRRALHRAVQAQGFTVSPTRCGHVRVHRPGGTGLVILPSSPSDHRSVLNAVALLRRQGFAWPRR